MNGLVSFMKSVSVELSSVKISSKNIIGRYSIGRQLVLIHLDPRFLHQKY